MTNRTGRRRRHREAKRRGQDRRRIEAMHRAAERIGRLCTTLEAAGKLWGEIAADPAAVANAWNQGGLRWMA